MSVRERQVKGQERQDCDCLRIGRKIDGTDKQTYRIGEYAEKGNQEDRRSPESRCGNRRIVLGKDEADAGPAYGDDGIAYGGNGPAYGGDGIAHDDYDPRIRLSPPR
ncbi:hypothetical protein CDO73_13275 [Saccharibacillus sp. O23]|nr:hypothetical protein CDO73_13275 [Saccharibacillus sp. O23]